MAETTSGSGIEQLLNKAELSLKAAFNDVQGLRSGLNIGGVGVDPGSLEAGNSACDSGCDGGCAGGLISAADIKAIGLGRLNAIFEARKVAGIERIGLPGGGLEAGNDACDSGCDGGCGGLTAPGGGVVRPAARA